MRSLSKTPGARFVPPARAATHADDASIDSGGPQTPDLQSFNNTCVSSPAPPAVGRGVGIGIGIGFRRRDRL